MLTRPCSGWTDFSLEGTQVYGLSYLDDIAFDWTEQAIHGLETMKPFCVKGFMEPGRVLCTVSFWNCLVVVEEDDWRPLKAKELEIECSRTSMIEFCKTLYEDIRTNFDDWVLFAEYDTEGVEEKRQRLLGRLERLKELIAEKEKLFCGKREFH